MKRERRQLTKRELAAVTSRRPVVRRIPPPLGRRRDARKATDEGGG